MSLQDAGTISHHPGQRRREPDTGGTILKRILCSLGTILLAACGSADSPSRGRSADDEPPPPAAANAAPAAWKDTAAPAHEAPPVLVALDGEGLRLVETATARTRLLPFGAPAAEVEKALTRTWGPWRERSRLPDCGAEPPTMLGWSNGVTVLLADDVFAGWGASRPRPGADGAPLPAVQSMAGLGVGTERAKVEEAYVLRVRETTLGTEFETGGISGVFEDASPRAEVASLWAGRACLFR